MEYSNEIINAYADGELQGNEKLEFEKELESNAQLRQQIDALYELKMQLQHTYKKIEPPIKQDSAVNNSRYASYVMLLVITFIGGWFSGDSMHRHADKLAQQQLLNPAMKVIAEQPGKYILHIGVHDKDKFKQTLDQAELLLASYQHNNKNIQLEIIANAGGLDLFRENTSPYAQRVKQLSLDYPNIKFIACSNAIDRLREQGIEPELINAVHQGKTAIDQVVMRVNQGWSYIKI